MNLREKLLAFTYLFIIYVFCFRPEMESTAVFGRHCQIQHRQWTLRWVDQKITKEQLSKLSFYHLEKSDKKVARS